MDVRLSDSITPEEAHQAQVGMGHSYFVFTAFASVCVLLGFTIGARRLAWTQTVAAVPLIVIAALSTWG
jgi:predicted membrane-bound mannosyltransferase